MLSRLEPEYHKILEFILRLCKTKLLELRVGREDLEKFVKPGTPFPAHLPPIL